MLSGAVKCWGSNSDGQLGNGNFSGPQVCFHGSGCSIDPVDVIGLSSGIVEVGAGGFHSCARTATGGLTCWGSGGQLGNRGLSDSSVPLNVAGPVAGAAALTAGYLHNCAIRSAGGLKCWGVNLAGQVGDGTNDSVLQPVGVSGKYAPPDSDGDGCPDEDELQTASNSQVTGGRRDELNERDYFNPTGDGRNRIDDILLVLSQYFDDDDDANPGLPPYEPGYNPDTDRTLVGPQAWNLGPPNGLQRIDDIVNVLNHYFHDCS
jgi:hypothetical protein